VCISQEGDLVFNDFLKTAKRVIADSAIPANAAIVFIVAADDPTITYDAVGNPIISDGDEITLTCWLRQGKAPDNEVQSGLNLDSEYFEGELIEPKTYPIPLRPVGDIRCTVDGRSGTFTPLDYFDSPAASGWEIRDYQGQKIAGWIQFREGE
jgi:hypothetical protein